MVSAFASAASRLRSALERPDKERLAALRDYMAVRDVLGSTVSPDDRRYLEFQLWQEGVARWTEIAASERSRDPAMRKVGRAQRQAVLDELDRADLRSRQRAALYAFGAAEAMLLEQCGARWRNRYPAVMSMAPLLRAALDDCAPVGMRTR